MWLGDSPMDKRTSMIPISKVCLAGNERKYVLDAIDSTWVSSKGRYIDEFERLFAAYVGTRHAVCVSNGSCALMLALKAARIQPGDEVIVPSLTFAASVNAIIHVGAIPVLVDSEEDHWNIDPDQIRLAITEKTRAIMPVHLYGHPCNMREIIDISSRYDIQVIEDAAEAQGARCLGKMVGALGYIGCFSFFGNKIMTTGEGGMCVTDDDRLNKLMRQLRDHGMSVEKRYWHETIGYNFRMTNVNAAIGVAQMEGVERFLKRRAALASMYEEGVSSIPGLRVYDVSPYGSKIDWLQCVFVEEGYPLGRDDLIAKLKAYNIDSRPTFYPVHDMPPYRKCRTVGDMPHSRAFGRSGINLPLYPSLNDEDVQYVIEVLRDSG